MTDHAIYKNFIGGDWVASRSGETYENFNPARTDDLIGRFQASVADDAEAAIAAAQEALPGWANLSPMERARFIMEAAAVLRSRLESIAAELTREEGKTLVESRAEIRGAIVKMEYMAGEGRRLVGQVIPSANSGVAIQTLRDPLGVVALITPWNFPFSMPSGKIAAALVTGNTAILKPASVTPLTALRLVETYEAAGLPPGVLNVLTGAGGILGRSLVRATQVRGVSFTGSTAVGRQIAQDAAGNFTKIQLEMGGKNPLVILADADIAQAVKVTIQGAFGSAGQKCTATSRVIVAEEIAKRFLDELVVETSRLIVGDGMESHSQIGPIASLSQMESILDHINGAKAEGARLILGGERLTGGKLKRGYYVAPTIFDQVTPGMRVAREEIFGPVLAVLQVSSFDQAVDLANDTEYGLSAGICTKSLKDAELFARSVQAGIVKVNEATTGTEPHVPFPGKKQSAVAMGGHPVDFFSETKVVYSRYA